MADKEIRQLLKSYRKNGNITFEDIVDFHYKFEKIHPFQDGNGRVGRLIMFKECLKYNIPPFIIEDVSKDYYRRGLNEYTTEKGFLIETWLKHYIFNIEDNSETDNIILNALEGEKRIKSDQSDQKIILFSRNKKAENLGKSRVSTV